MQPKPTPTLTPRDPNKLETQARDILSLEENEPTPQAQLDPQAMAILADLDPEDQAEAMSVIGCAQELKEQVAAASRMVASKMAAAVQQIREDSFGKKLTLQRFVKGAPTEADVERARGFLTDKGNGAAIDPVETGIFELLGKNRKMLALMGTLGVKLKAADPEGSGPVLEILGQQADGLKHEADGLAGSMMQAPEMALGEAVAGFEIAQDIKNKPRVGGIASNTGAH